MEVPFPISPDDQGHWVHHISPYAIHFGHVLGMDLGIRWYGLAYVIGLVWGWWLLHRWVRQGRCPLRPEWIQDFVLFAGLGMIIGGRVGYCVFYGWPELVANPIGHMGLFDQDAGRFLAPHEVVPPDHQVVRRFEWPFLLQMWNGGMASHGGILGLAVGCWLFTRRHGISFLVMGDMISAAGPIGVALGRVANFINGELWGRPSHVAWAVIFPDAAPIDGFAVARHPSQLYAVVLEGLLPLAIALPIHARHRRPILTSGVVLTCYAIGRFCDEYFREPDRGQPGYPGVPAILGFMSKGQAFTVPVFAVGVLMVVWAMTHRPRPDLYLTPVEATPPEPQAVTPPVQAR